MAFETGISSPYRSMRLVTARRMIDVAVEHIAMDNPVAIVDPLKATRKAQELADQIEGVANALLQFILQADIHPVREAGKNTAVRGEVFIKVIPPADYPLYPERKKGEPEKKFGERMEEWEQMVGALPPVKWEIPDPMNVYCSLSHRQHTPLHVLESYYRDYDSIVAEYPDWKNPKRHQPGDQVEWLEYYDWDWRYFEADGEAVSSGVEPNLLGRPPYVHFYSGFGKKAPEGYLGPGGKSSEGVTRASLARSIIFPARDTIIAQSRVQSQLDSAIALYTHPGVVTSLTEKELKEVEFGPGHIISGVPKDARFEVNNGIAPDPALFQHAINIGNELEKYMPSPLGGSVGGESGYQQATAIGQGSLKYQGIKEVIQHALEGGLSLSFLVMKLLLRHRIVLRGYPKGAKSAAKYFSIDPDKLDDYIPIKVKLEPADPEFKDRRALIGLRLREKGEMSRETVMQDYYGVPNATEEITRLYAERIIEESPEIKAVIARKALQELGMEEELAALEAEQAAAQQNAESIQRTMNATIPNQGRGSPVEPADLMVRQLRRMGGPQHPGALGSRLEEAKPL